MSTCTICHTNLNHDETGTCLTCINTIRQDLSAIIEHWHQLPDAIATITAISYDHNTSGSKKTLDDVQVVGGAALTMLAGGTANTVTSSRRGNRDHARDNLPDDPPSAAAVLATIEDDWRHQLGHPAADYILSTRRSADWLHRNAHLAARVHDLADDADTIHQLRVRMAVVTGRSTAPVKTDYDCFDCGTRLIRRWTKEGLETQIGTNGEQVDVIVCPTCERRYTDATAKLAIRNKLLSAVESEPDAQVTEPDARRLFPGLATGTIRTWIARGKLTKAGRDERGRATYRVGDIHHLTTHNTPTETESTPGAEVL